MLKFDINEPPTVFDIENHNRIIKKISNIILIAIAFVLIIITIFYINNINEIVYVLPLVLIACIIEGMISIFCKISYSGIYQEELKVIKYMSKNNDKIKNYIKYIENNDREITNWEYKKLFNYFKNYQKTKSS